MLSDDDTIAKAPYATYMVKRLAIWLSGSP